MERVICRVLQSVVLLVLASGCGVSLENATAPVLNWSSSGDYTVRVRVSTNGAEVVRALALRDDGTRITLSEADNDLWEGTLSLPRCTEGFGLRYRVDYQIDDQDEVYTESEPVEGTLLFRIRNVPANCSPGSRREFVVNDLGDAVDLTPGDGVCRATGNVCTLRAAVMESNALPGANSVLLPEGTITLSLTEGENRFGIVITDSLSIRGDPPDEGRQIRTTLTVDREAGEKSLEGPAIASFPFFIVGRNDSDISVSIDAVRLTGGFGLYGGAVANYAKLFVSRSRIDSNNSSVHGGAIYNSGSLTLEDVWLRNNRAALGGAIYSSGNVVSRSCTLSANTASDQGGAVHSFIGRLEFWNSTISGNVAPQGGGLDFMYPVTALLRNSTITLNRAEDSGGGIFAERQVELALSHTLIAGNVAGEAGTHDADAVLSSVGYNVIGICTTSAVSPCALTLLTAQDQFGSNRVPLDAVLGPLFGVGVVTPVHVPDASSPAVNAGNTIANDANAIACTRLDQLDRSRPRGGACDIGAVEL